MAFGLSAAAIGGIAAGAGVLGGALIGSKAAGDAADSQANSTRTAIDEQRRQFDLTRGDYAPYRAAGTNALTQLVGDVNTPVSGAEVTSEPGYQFGLEQGQQAINRRIAASGGRVSGQAIKAAARFGTDYATSGYGAAYQRKQDRLNRLAAIAGIGQSSTAGSAVAGQNSANQISGLMSSQGDATGASQLAKGNIWGNAGNQIAALYGRSQQPSGGGGVNVGQGWSSNPESDPYYMGG